MKSTLLTVIGCLTLSMTSLSFAWSDSACSGGSCGASYCNPYESNCQCTDPACSHPEDTDCISRAYCCEAFGNIGAR
ncbi:hypothetical protein AQUSIP_02110 [Aquicella siphonis]|uniref:Uncharacterized protein n=1 Tax=Aquicella siphonis TaxID=254247 RepID=A0A5E4PET8_9COXI|nr:hypothetical protein [Aquicella siphonis]VVC74937.1 hypothetical protein AQUSIP_02110 [Aquicella siphonis]